MDTREKILAPVQALELAHNLRRIGSRIRVVTGYFDVLLADHVRRLKQLMEHGRPEVLFVVLSTPAEPILPLRARAELVAALSVVDYVIPVATGTLEALLTGLSPDEVLRAEANDERRTQELIEYVHRRQKV